MSRRGVLGLAALAAAAAGALGGAGLNMTGPAKAIPLRPPGALPEDRFLAACIRCFQCGSVCPNQSIQFEGTADGLARAFAPLIKPREQACILCMRCTQACPTGALQPISTEPAAILREVRMGTAEVDAGLCYSHNGRICGVCYYACPFPDTALKLGPFATPQVVAENCVGCGSCERACIHLPQAIRVAPREARA